MTSESSLEGDGVADLTASDFRLDRPTDILDLIGRGVQRIVIARVQINPHFYDLSTGFAGELVQKCVNYGLRVAVVGEFQDRSPSFRQFVSESNRGTRFVFVASVDEGRARLSS
jgi:hypothetical protein